MQKLFNGIFIVPFFILSTALQAQVNSVSPYSRLGIGEFQSENYARALGFGGANLAIPDPYYINYTNPASYSNLDLTTFEVGFKSSLIEQEQRDPDILIKNSNAGLRYFNFAVPLTDWWGSAIGIQPYTARGYDISQSRMGPDSIGVQERFVGTGGLNTVYWGNAVSVAEGLSFGVNASFIFGSLREQNMLNWGGGINNSVIDEQVTSQGFRFDYGAMYNYEFENQGEISLGLSFANSSSLSTDVDGYWYITDDAGRSIDTVVNAYEGEIILPNELSFGISYGQKTNTALNYAWAIAADIEVFEGDEFVNYDGTGDLANSYRAELGGFVTPVLAFENISRSGNYLAQIEYRIGGYYEKTPLQVDAHQLEEYGINFGIGLPVRQRGLGPGEVRRSVINAGVVLGRRGSLDHGLIRENFLQLYIGLTLNDKWFIKYKYR